MIFGQQLPKDLWKLSFNSMDNFKVEMNVYQGRQLIIACIDAYNPDTHAIRVLDSLNKLNNVSVIGVLVTDFNKAKTSESILKMVQDAKISFPLTKLTSGKRNSGADQHPLMKWITSGGSKTHYSTDLNDPGQVFFINTNSILYAVLSKQVFTSPNLLSDVLSNVPEN